MKRKAKAVRGKKKRALSPAEQKKISAGMTPCMPLPLSDYPKQDRR
jgi:hypothetical protein